MLLHLGGKEICQYENEKLRIRENKISVIALINQLIN